MIHEHLYRGRDNSRTGRELARLLHVNIRTIVSGVERERAAGWPICSESYGKYAGYYLAANEDERQKCVESLGRRAREIYNACTALKECCLDGPTEESEKPLSGNNRT